MNKIIIVLFSLVSLTSFSQAPLKLKPGAEVSHDLPGSLSQRGDSLFISITPAQQSDLDQIQNTMNQINEPGYVQKQTALLQDKAMTILGTIVKGKISPDSIDGNGFNYHPGRIAVKLKRPQK